MCAASLPQFHILALFLFELFTGGPLTFGFIDSLKAYESSDFENIEALELDKVDHATRLSGKSECLELRGGALKKKDN